MNVVAMKVMVLVGAALLSASIVVHAAMPEDFPAIAIRLHEQIMEAATREDAADREQEVRSQQYEQLLAGRRDGGAVITCWSNESYQRLVAQLGQVMAERDQALQERDQALQEKSMLRCAMCSKKAFVGDVASELCRLQREVEDKKARNKHLQECLEHEIQERDSVVRLLGEEKMFCKNEMNKMPHLSHLLGAQDERNKQQEKRLEERKGARCKSVAESNYLSHLDNLLRGAGR